MAILPTTVLSGFLGAGKTTTLNHILNNLRDRRVAVIVNDLSAVNIDQQLLQTGGATVSRTQENLVGLSNGCICCELRDDLRVEVRKLAAMDRFDYLLIESTGIADPLPIAETFAGVDEDILSDVARLDTMVTVVAADTFLRDFNSIEEIADRGWDADDDRPIAALLVDQVEFANVILLNKTDLVDPKQLDELEALLKRLNPDAQVIRTEKGQVPPDAILNTDRFDYASMMFRDAAIEDADDHAHTHDHDHDHFHGEEYGISSFVYRARRPFHPERLMELLEGDDLQSLLRSKGIVWLATRHDLVGMWSQVGQLVTLDYAGEWWATMSPAVYADDPDLKDAVESLMDGEFGDRRQKLAIIGQHMKEDAVRAALDSCLLTDAEMAGGAGSWQTFNDPFGEWEVDE